MRVLVSAGEYSGDLYAARMLHALRENLQEPLVAFGMGGHELQNIGAEIFINSTNLQTHGLIEAIPHFFRLMNAFKTLVRLADAKQPDWALLVDFPDFHLRLAAALKKRGIPVVQFVAPTAWAWRPGRIRTLKNAVNKLLVIFPFEEPFFREQGINADFIGHPLLDLIRIRLDRESFLHRYGWKEPIRVIGLMPGSRPREVTSLLPPMLASLPRIQDRLGAIQPVLIPAPTIPPDLIQSILAQHSALPVTLIKPDEKYDAMANADILICASGTAALEAMLVRTPAVVVYQVHPMTAWIARRLIHVRFVSMVNILAGTMIQPELLQNDVTPDTIANHVIHILTSPEALKRIFGYYFDVADQLGCLHAFEEGPRVLESFLRQCGVIQRGR